MENNQDEAGKPKGFGVESGPTAMGIAMAKKMMAQMSQGGSPMEMMAQMSQGGDAAADGEDDGHVHGHVFGDAQRDPPDQCPCRLRDAGAPARLRRLAEGNRGQAEALLADSDKDAAALAAALKISEESVTYILARLAARGKITLAGKARI